MKREPGQRKTRDLTRHELDLWLHVTRDVRRSRSAAATPQFVPAIDPASLSAPKSGPSRAVSIPATSPAVGKQVLRLPPLAPIEPKIRRRLSRRQISVDAVLDLHGMRQDQAHLAVQRFLHQCHEDGGRLVLIVTGKGDAPDGAWDDFRRTGVLRQIVPHWLREPALRKFVIGFEEAAPSQGGYGALYVRIRRPDGHPGMGAR